MSAISCIAAATFLGLQRSLVAVEIVLPGSGARSQAMRERMFRVDAAVNHSGYDIPDGGYTLNLASYLPTAGAGHLDLAAAIALLAATGQLPPARTRGWMFIGELSLGGEVRSVPGTILLVATAKEAGLAGIIVPEADAAEAAAISGIDVRCAGTLGEVVKFLIGQGDLHKAEDHNRRASGLPDRTADMSDVKGQEAVKRALEIAAAGAHNVLLVGPPGGGKTMLAQRLPGILPPLTEAEALEVTIVASAARMLGRGTGIVQVRPFRNPHPTMSAAAMIGGGTTSRPGEVSLAHNGVLFLDELAEFSRHALDVLRAPAEAGEVALIRGGISLRYPARFILVAAMNPCPCGYHGDSERRCTCPSRAVQRYLGRVPTALLDQFDLHVEVPAVRYRDLVDRRAGELSESIRGRVSRARDLQRTRFAGRPDVGANAQMSVRDVREHCPIGEGAEALLRTAITRLGLSPRAYHRILKIARTIADMGGSEDISSAHVSEAIQYRFLDRCDVTT